MRTLTLSTLTVLALAACNKPPEGLDITLDPENPTTIDDLVMTVIAEADDPNKSDTIGLEILWFQDDEERPEYTTSTVPSSATARDQVWEVRVRATDGKEPGPYVTASVTVLNTAPSATVQLKPDDPLTDDDLIATPTTDDIDGDTVNMTYVWSVDGTTAPDVQGPTVSASQTRHGEVWKVTATPSDGDKSGEEATASVTIQNTAPVAETVTLTPSEVYEYTTIEAYATGVDIDSDTLTWTYTWFVSGGEVKTGADNTLNGRHFNKGDDVLVEAVANDGFVDSAPATSDSVAVLNTLPVVTGVRLSPVEATEATELMCVPAGSTDADGDTVTLAYAWTVDDVAISATTATLTGADFDKGQVVRCSITPSDDQAAGAAVRSNISTIVNAPPVVASAAISPATADRTDTLSVALGALSDADGDSVTVAYDWSVNASSVSTDATLAGKFVKGDEVVVSVTPNDGTEDGAAVLTSAVTIGNAPPALKTVSASPTVAYTNTTLRGSYTATDPDADKITVTWAWMVNDTSAGTADSLEGSKFKKADKVQVFATASDGTDADGPRGSNVITIRNSPPTMPSIAMDPAAPYLDDPLYCEITKTSTDPDADRLTYEFTWTRSGKPWTGATTKTTYPGDTIAGATTRTGEVWACRANADDGTANSTLTAPVAVAVRGYFVPPRAGTLGTYGVISGNGWKVCRGADRSAWVSANNSGTYNATKICQSFGYTGADAKGGTCGLVCGYCGTPGREHYDGAGGAYTSLGYTVHWRCAR